MATTRLKKIVIFVHIQHVQHVRLLIAVTHAFPVSGGIPATQGVVRGVTIVFVTDSMVAAHAHQATMALTVLERVPQTV